MLSFVFKPWRRLHAIKDNAALYAFLRAVADEAKKAFTRGIRSGKSGRVYHRGGRSHRASAPGEYPARDTGALERSISTRVSRVEATIGTTTFYSIFLRNGTSQMARRKMSDDALKEGVGVARSRLKRWARFTRG